MAAKKAPQELINEFWEKTVAHSTDPCVTTTLPQSIFVEGFHDQVPKNPGVAENVMADYQRAVEKCIAKVEKISKECRLSNQKYTDPTFDLFKEDYCLRPLSTCVPPERGAGDEKPIDPPPGPPKMTLSVDNETPINLTMFISPRRDVPDDVPEASPGHQPQSVKRVEQIFDKPEFFVDGATADDVRQGDAADCWFLSALSALCSMEAKELGNLVDRVCVKRDEAAGVYGFLFYRDGEWRSEIVDDKLYLSARDYKYMDNSSEMNYLLKYIKEKDRAEQYRKIVQSNSDALYYAKSAHKNETWVPLIEKAYAKAHGDFTAIENGLVGDGIEDLTGGLASFCITEDIVDRDKFWDEGLAQVNKSFLWGCSTAKVNELDKRGIVGMHAYSMLEARTIPDGTRLLKIRNPYGKSEWEGDWSDRSKKWTDELKKLLKHEDKDDGIFWISYQDLLRNYPYLHRTRIFDASWTVAQLWTNFTVPLLSSDTYEKTFKFTLPKAATTVLVLSQLDDRYFRGMVGQYEFGLSFRLHKLDEDDYLYRCHHRHFNDRSINLEVDLEAGVYEVRLKVTSERRPERPKIEDVVRINWKDSRDKLLQICRSYDLAHAKVAPPKQQVADKKVKEATQKPEDERRSANQDAQVKPGEEISSEVKETKSESKSAEPDHNPEIDVHAKASVTSRSLEDAKSDSPVHITHQGHKSDTDTHSTEPEMIDKPDANPQSEARDQSPEGASAPRPDKKDLDKKDLDKKDDEKDKEKDKGDDLKRYDQNEEDDKHSRIVEKHDDDDNRPAERKDDELDEPFNSVCTVGLRVYCKDAEARVELMKSTTALVQDKQFTSSEEKKLDVDDPAKP